MKKTITLLLSLILLTGTLGAQEHFSDVKTKTLANGLTIAVKEVRESPLAYIQLTYKVGFRDSPENRTEMPHFVEHMLFKGTPRFLGDKFSLLVTENGGWLNGYTSWDRTSYLELVPSYQVKQILEMEASRMTEAQFSEDQVATEKNVVLSEVRNYAGAQTNTFNKDVLTQLGLKTRENYDFEPRIKGLENLTVQEATAFYKKYYRPDNAILVVTGDVNTQEVFAWAQEYFGPIAKPAQALVPTVAPFKPITQDISVKGSGIVQQPFGYRYFNFKPWAPKSRDYVIMFFLTASGLIPEMSLESYPEGGYIVQNFNNPAPSPLEVLDWEILAKQFPHTKTKLLENRKQGYEELEDFSSALTDGLLTKNDPGFEDWLNIQFATVEFPEVRTFLEKYLGKGPNLVAEFKLVSANQESTNFNARSTSDNFSQIQDVSFLESRSPEAAKYYENLGENAYKGIQPRLLDLLSGIKTVTLENRLKLIIRKASSSTMGYINLLIPAGISREKVPFAASRTAEMVFTGGPQTPLRREISLNGVNFSNGSANTDFAFAGISGPGAQLKPMIQVLSLALSERSFSGAVVAAETEKNLNNLAKPTKDMGYWIEENTKALYKTVGSASYNPQDSSAEERATISPEVIKEFYTANYRPQGSILIISSPEDPQVVADLVRQELANWKNPETPPFPPRENSALGKSKEEVQKFALVDKAQENIVIFTQAIATKDYPFDREVQFDIGSSILGDTMTGRLFRNLRIKQGLTYNATTWDISQADRSMVFGGYIQASAKNLDKAISGWKAELKTIQTEGPTPVEYAFAKNKLINKKAFDFRNAGSIHNYMIGMAVSGLPLDQELKTLELLRKSDLESFKTIWKEDLDPDKFLISITGPGRAGK